MNRFQWMATIACLMITNVSADPPGIDWSLPAEALEPKPPLNRSIDSIQFQGLETVPIEMLREALESNLDVLEAQHPSIDDRTFRQVVTRELARGFEHCGYLEHELTCQTQPSEEIATNQLRFEITEGPRFRRGEITIRWESNRQDEQADATLARVMDHLHASTFIDDKTEKPVWEIGDIAWYGHRSTWEIVSRIRDAIRPISDQADAVDVQTELVSTEHRVRLAITLPDDFVWKTPSHEFVFADETIAANPVAMEIQQIHRDYFQDVTPGYEIETNSGDLRLKYATVDDESCLEMMHQDGRHIASAWMSPHQLSTGFQSRGETAWNLPVRNGVLVIGLIEDETRSDDFRINITINAASNRKKHSQSDPTGFRIATPVWRKLFPATTQKEARGNTIIYRHGDNEIRCDDQGVPQHLTLIRSPNNQVIVNRIGDTYFRDTIQRLFPNGSNREWVIRPDIDDPTRIQTLANFLYGDDAINANTIDETGMESVEGKAFWIPPQYRSVDAVGHFAMRMARELNLIAANDPLDPLLKLAVLTHSKRFATVPERLDEVLAGDAGAISDAAFAWFAIEAKCYDRAKELLNRSRVDSSNFAKVQHNVRRWLRRDSMLGQVLAQTDVQAICDFVTTHFDTESRWAIAAGNLAGYLPDATTDDERYQNAINTISFAWVSMHPQVLDPLTAHVAAKLEAEKQKANKVAEKKKADKNEKVKTR